MEGILPRPEAVKDTKCKYLTMEAGIALGDWEERKRKGARAKRAEETQSLLRLLLQKVIE